MVEQGAYNAKVEGSIPSPPTEQWYDSLIDELQDIITETSFVSRWALIEGYHQVGSRILQENENFERSQIYGQDIVQRIAESLGKRPRTIYYAIQFAREYPNLNLLPEGKNVSWWKIINKYLTPETDKAKRPTVGTLIRIIEEIKNLLELERLKAFQEGQSSRVEFIRYLQDQVNKITEGLDGR